MKDAAPDLGSTAELTCELVANLDLPVGVFSTNLQDPTDIWLMAASGGLARQLHLADTVLPCSIYQVALRSLSHVEADVEHQDLEQRVQALSALVTTAHSVKTEPDGRIFTVSGRTVSTKNGYALRLVTFVESSAGYLADRDQKEILQSLEEGVLIYSRNGRLIWNNRAIQKILDLSLADLTPGTSLTTHLAKVYSVFDDVDPDVRVSDAAALEDAILTSAHGRRTLVSGNGRRLDISHRKTASGIRLTVSDRTETHLADTELKLYSDTVDQILSNFPIILTTKSIRTGRYTSIRQWDGFRKEFGRPDGSDEIEDVDLPVSLMRAFDEMDQHVSATGETIEGRALRLPVLPEFRDLEDFSAVRTLLVTKKVLRLVDGDDQILTACLDVSDAERARESAEEHRDLLTAAIDALDDAILVYESDHLLLCNSRIDMIGLEDPDQVESLLEFIFHIAGQAKDESGSYTLLAALIYPEVELPPPAASESAGTQAGGGMRLPGAGPRVSSQYIVMSDGRTLNIQRLEVPETYQLVLRISDVSKFVEEQEIAQQIARMETSTLLTRGVSHDLSNQLTVGIGAFDRIIENARQSWPDFQANRELFNRLEDVLSGAINVTKRLLTQSAAADTRPERIDVVEFVGDVVEGARTHFDARVMSDLNLSMVVGKPPPPAVMIDRGDFRNVITNMIANAIEALHGEGRIVVFLDTHQGKARIVVADDGPGIDPALIHSIFDPGFTMKSSGHGLGLFTVQNAIRRAGGSVSVVNGGPMPEPAELENVGAMFTVLLPAASSVHAVHPEVRLARALQRRAALVIHQDRDAIAQLRENMIRAGIQVIQIATSQRAEGFIGKAQMSTPVGLILFDPVTFASWENPHLAGELVERCKPEFMVAMSDIMSGDTLTQFGRTVPLIHPPFTIPAVADALFSE